MLANGIESTAKTHEEENDSLSIEEQDFIDCFINELTIEQLQKFFAEQGLKKLSGFAKSSIKAQTNNWLASKIISIKDMIHFMDRVSRWGRQHVFLLRGPAISLKSWRIEKWLGKHLKEHGVDKLYRASAPHMLPSNMQISRIDCSNDIFEVIAIKKYTSERSAPNLDKYEHTSDQRTGERRKIHFKAYIENYKRCLIALEWNLITNAAALYIGQLPSECSYEKAKQEFESVTSNWLELRHFSAQPLASVIRHLNEQEVAGKFEAISPKSSYQTPEGRIISGRNISPHDSVMGERIVDGIFATLRNEGVGHDGDFIWQASEKSSLTEPVHIRIIADKNRINFPSPAQEHAVRHVLSRMRTLI